MGSHGLTESLSETLALFDGDGEPRTTSEVADRLGLGRRSTYDRLERLVDHDRLKTKKVGASARVWWRPSDGTASTGSESEDVLSRLIDNVPGVVYRCQKVPGWPMSFVSQAARDLTGYEPAAIERGEVSWGDDVVHPDDRERLRREVDEQLATSDEFSVDYRIRTVDGETRWVHERGCAVDVAATDETVLEGVVTEVTERKRSERALAEREQQFRTLVEETEEYAIFRLGPAGHVQTWNAGAERLKGYRTEEIVGEHFSTFYTEEDREAGVPAENLVKADEDGSVEDEGWRVRADGTRFWANVTITAIRDDDGDLQGYAKVTRDMTDRRAFERELERERDLLERVFEAVPESIAVLDETGDPVRMNERMRRYLGVEDTDAEPDSLAGDTVFDEDGDPVPPGERPYDRALRTGDPVREWVGRFDLPGGGERWLSVNAVPITGEDGAVDQVVVSAEDVTQLKEQARRLERRRADLENELEELLRRVDDAFFALDDEWRFTYVNERAAQLLDRSRSELVGRTLWEEFPETVDTQFQAEYERARETNESVSFESYYPPLEAWLAVSAYPSESGLSVYFQDVTERKERERELERYETIVETVDDGIYVVDEEGYFTEVNETYASMVGLPPEALLGEHISTVVDDEKTLSTAKRIEDALFDGEQATATLETALTDAEGEEWVGEATFSLMGSGTGDGYERVGVVRDVTDRRARERELEQYERIVETVDDGIYALDDDDRYVLVNDAFCSMLGYEREEILGEKGSLVYDDEYTPVIEERAGSVIEGEREAATIEFELLRKDGSRIPVETRYEPFPYGEGYGRCGVVRDVSERIERERELQRRIRQQAVVTDLGQRALESRDIDALMADAVERVAATLDTDYCKVLDLDDEAGELLVRQGVGWDEGVVGEATVSAVDDDSQAAHTLASAEPVVVEDLPTETRFSGPALLTDHDVRSGISVVVGPPDGPWGVLGAHDTDAREFSDQDVNFVQSVATILATAIGRHRDEQALVRQREQLAALNSLNEVVREITDAVLDQSTRAEIERTVCEHLASADSYRFAWIGEVDATSQTVEPRAEAGAEGYLDAVTVSVDPDDERSEGPTGRAIRTGAVHSIQHVKTDPHYEPWRDVAEEHGFASSAAIPVVYDGTTYGVLNVYAERSNAFEGHERTVLRQLGEVVGHAIAATQRKQALMSDEVVELEFQIRDLFERLDVADQPEGRFSFDHVVTVGDGEFLVYGEAAAEAVPTLETLVDRLPHWTDVSFTEDEGDGDTRFELRMDEPPVLSTLASLGGSVERALVEDGDYRMTLHLSPSADVRQVIDAVQDAYPSATMLRRQQVTKDDDHSRPTAALLEGLTDRQRTTLEAAYHAGFFEWPRDASGEDVAESLQVSPPTFHQHLRKAEGKVFGGLFEVADDSSSTGD
ncbi:PAS domain S-box protein [Halosimplex salinum]|uniref:PAS domain S-box protein n=1 Tax=Halosimplex salinum TaxID=1710538 RepID=UPI0019D24F26|nr:PAS domain S-box protein [Halosimplex salinum]